MGKKTLAEVQKGTSQKAYELESKPDHIRVNGHWIDNDTYEKDPKAYNAMPFAEGYLEECGVDPSTVKEELLPESLKKAS